jgi:hypothetical protein
MLHRDSREIVNIGDHPKNFTSETSHSGGDLGRSASQISIAPPVPMCQTASFGHGGISCGCNRMGLLPFSEIGWECGRVMEWEWRSAGTQWDVDRQILGLEKPLASARAVREIVHSVALHGPRLDLYRRKGRIERRQITMENFSDDKWLSAQELADR